MAIKKTTEQYVSEVRGAHGDMYDYSLVEYGGCLEKVKIICRKHGVFEQVADRHLNGAGCRKCYDEGRSAPNKSNTIDFVEKASLKHDNIYDYSLVEYVDCFTKVEIVCSKHGSFWQAPGKHLYGNGCPKCRHEKTGDRNRKSKEKFIADAEDVHDGEYDYSLVDYVSSVVKVDIICRKHGVFSQTPSNHLKGRKCPKCNHENTSVRFSSNTDRFTESAINVHGKIYDYSKVNYVSAIKKVVIVCRKHGEFCQTPNDHLNGKGCPRCKDSRYERKLEVILDEMKLNYRREAKFSSCKYKSKLRFDFQIFTHDGFILLEMDGEQHSKPVELFGGENGFAETKKRDEIKSAWARRRKITLHRLNHKDIKMPKKELKAKILDMLSTRIVTKKANGIIPITVTKRIRVSGSALQVAPVTS